MYNFIQAEQDHAVIFPRANVKSQILKLNEEWKEYNNATSIEDALSEYGDFLLVCISLRRFSDTRLMADALLDKYYFSYPADEQKTFMKYIEKAVNKCRARPYYFKDGIYDRDR